MQQELELDIESKPKRVPSPEEIEAAKTPNGGWTKATLAQWGVAWPPQSGWKQALLKQWKDSVR